MNIKRIAIIKGYNEETGKQEIERIVIFNVDGSVEVQNYSRLEHLRLINQFLKSNDYYVFEDGLKKGIRAGIVSIVNREDEIAMSDLENDVLEAQILNEGKLVKEVAEEVEGISEDPDMKKEVIPSSDNLEKMKKYLNYGYMRDRNVLPPSKLNEIEEMARTDAKISEIEKLRVQYLNNEISEDQYRETLEEQRAMVNAALAELTINKAEETPVAPAEAEEVKSESVELNSEATAAPVETEDNAPEVTETPEEVIEETTEDDETPTSEASKEVSDELIIGEGNVSDSEEETEEEEKKNNEEEESSKSDEVVSDGFAGLNRETPVEPKNDAIAPDADLDAIYKRAVERAQELANNREKTPVTSGNVEETEEKQPEVQRVIINEPVKEVVKRAEEPVAKTEEPVIIGDGTVSDPEEETEEKQVEVPRIIINEPVREVVKKAEEPVAKTEEPVIIGDGTVSDPEEDKVQDNNSKEFVFVGDAVAHPNPDKIERDKKKQEVVLPGLKLNRNIIPGTKVVGYVEEDDNDPDKNHGIEEEVVDIPSESDDIHASESSKKVRVKKRNRVWAIVVAAVLGVVGLGALAISRIFGGKNNNRVLPTPTPAQITPGPIETVTPTQTNEEVSPTPAATQEVTVSEAVIVANSVTAYADRYSVPQETRNFLLRSDVVDFLSKFKNPDQRREIISALAFGYEMNYLTNKSFNFRSSESEPQLKSFCYDFICAKAFVNGYTPEQMAAAFGDPNFDYEDMMDGAHGFFNMLATYGIYATEIPPFRYLTNGETKDCKSFNQLFYSLSVVNQNRKANTLTSDHTDDFIVTADKLYGRGSGTQFTNEGAAAMGMAMVYAFNWGQSNIAYGEALRLQKDYGVSRAGLTLGLNSEGDGHYEFDGYNFLDLFTQANKGWGDENAYNENCYKYKQRLAENLEKAREIVAGSTSDTRVTFASKLEDYTELADEAEAIRNNTYTQETLDSIYAVASEKYPHLLADIKNFVSERSRATASDDLVSINTYAPEVDRFFGLGLREDYAYDEVMIYYVNKAHTEGLEKTFTDGEGHVITGKPPKDETSYGEPSGPPIPTVPAPTTTTTTTETPVDYDDLTPEEQQQVDEQVEEQQQQEDQEWQETIDHAEEVAQDVVDQYQAGEITEEQAQQQLEAAGVTVAPTLFGTLDGYEDEAEEIHEQADQENQQLTEQSEQAAEEQHQEEQQSWVDEHDDEEALIQQSMAIEQQASQPEEPAQDPEPAQEPAQDPEPAQEPAQDPEPAQEPEPEQVVENIPAPAEPAPDSEIDEHYGEDEEEVYVDGRNTDDLGRLVASENGFGLDEGPVLTKRL